MTRDAEFLASLTEHRDGIPWDQAPLPRRFHWCRAWTVGYSPALGRVERCACGAHAYGSMGGWSGKNSRRRAARSAGSGCPAGFSDCRFEEST